MFQVLQFPLKQKLWTIESSHPQALADHCSESKPPTGTRHSVNKQMRDMHNLHISSPSQSYNFTILLVVAPPMNEVPGARRCKEKFGRMKARRQMKKELCLRS